MNNKKIRAFNKIAEVRHIDLTCVICGDDTPEELIIEDITSRNNNGFEKTKQDEMVNKILQLSDDFTKKNYTILCFNCNMRKQYLFTHLNNKENKEEYKKMMENIKQEY